MKARAVLVLAVGMVLLPAVAAADVVVEDFDAPGGGFNNPLFNHNVGEAPGGGLWWEFFEGTYISPDWSLGLAPAMDTVTFNLDPGQYVDWAGVWVRSNSTPGVLEVIGTQGTFSDGTNTWDWKWVDTTGADIGQIVEIHLYGWETIFDDLKVNVVPEPASIGLVGLGLAALATRRRRGAR